MLVMSTMYDIHMDFLTVVLFMSLDQFALGRFCLNNSLYTSVGLINFSRVGYSFDEDSKVD